MQQLHGCTATLVDTVHVIEEFEGERVWDVDVYMFALDDHPSAETAYAWSVPVEGSERQRFYAVLHEGLVDSPKKAVRAAIVQAYRKEEET